MSCRDSILEGVKAAKRLHDFLGSERKIANTGGRVDVFGAALQQDAVLMFRNLTGILGAYLTEEGNTGIMVTTQRRLSVQRFTGAHELGHLVMGHEPSVDKEDILVGSATPLPPQEVEANAFASEFLVPRWLLAYHAARHGWDSTNMRDPVCVYQMALRVGVSYDAICRALQIHKLITQGTMQSLLGLQPKEVKRSILPAEYEPPNWRCDVWLLTEADHGITLEGHPEDLFVLRLREKTGSGYLWSADALRAEGFNVVHDIRESLPGEEQVGEDSIHEIVTGPAPGPAGRMEITEARPWVRTNPRTTLAINYDVQGKEFGMSRAERRRQHQAE